MSAESFLQSSCRTAMIIVPALLHRRSLKPEEVLNELQAVEAEEDNRFLGTTAWVHNNFVASVIQLFGPYSKTCPFYAGFEAFCKMSSGNIRHFLELCHQSCSRIADRLMEGSLVVDPLEQAEASKQASTTLLGEVRGFGRKGPQLLTFTHRLGSLFALAHSRKALSENEQTHFAITKGHRQFTAADEDFMREALKWSILFESESTKDKSEHHISESEFVLNPIYAPYFSISYRKKRRLELDLSDVITLIRGSIDEYSSLVRMYAKKWDIDSSDEEDLPLFRALEGGTGE